MPAVVVIGSQWGDEGKGKVIDLFSSQVDFVVRYQGGSNAGHTLKVNGEELVVHLIPSSVFHSKVKSVIASGVALDLSALCKEIKTLKQVNKLKDDSQLLISDSATLLLDQHKQLDQARENSENQVKIGTTGKGIGPAYEARASRKALIFSDLFEDESFLYSKLKEQMEESSFLLSKMYRQKPVSVEEVLQKMKEYREILEPYRCSDVSLMLHQALEEGKKALFEGAQGSLLDLFHGTYPYVTSSSTLAGGVLPSVGLGFKHFKKVVAIMKAYTTRVGSGPFPTECSEESFGHFLQEKGQEFGATTGRKRRCGWLDLPALKYTIRLNGVDSLVLTKLDVLSGLEEIKVCTAYQLEGRVVEYFPAFLKDFQKIQPLYKTFKGWKKDLSSIKSKEELPEEAVRYMDYICKELNTDISVISVGPSRAQTLPFKPLFDGEAL